MEKLFIITRRDIEPGAQAAQLCHGLAAFAAAQPTRFAGWVLPQQRIVICLAAPSTAALEQLLERLKESRVPTAEFRETDLDDELTAVACAAEGSRLVSSLPLALRERRTDP